MQNNLVDFFTYYDTSHEISPRLFFSSLNNLGIFALFSK